MIDAVENPNVSRTPVIRRGEPSDLDPLVSIHVRVWRLTYGRLAPAGVIEALGESARRPRWIEALRNGSTLVATVDDEVVAGFAQVGPPCDPTFGERGEIKHLYVDTGYARRGIGAQLLTAARALLRERGYPNAALGVVVGNEPALRFYETQGGRIVGRYRDPGPVWPSDNLVMAWDRDGTVG